MSLYGMWLWSFFSYYTYLITCSTCIFYLIYLYGLHDSVPPKAPNIRWICRLGGEHLWNSPQRKSILLKSHTRITEWCALGISWNQCDTHICYWNSKKLLRIISDICLDASFEKKINYLRLFQIFMATRTLKVLSHQNLVA